MAHCPTKMHIRPIDAACSVDRNPTSLRQRPLGMLTTQPADHGASDSTSQPRRIRGEPERAEHTRHSPPAVHPPLSSPGTRQSQQNFPTIYQGQRLERNASPTSMMVERKPVDDGLAMETPLELVDASVTPSSTGKCPARSSPRGMPRRPTGVQDRQRGR
jgi:hypothetical protein